MITLQVNGHEHVLQPPVTAADLIAALRLEGKRVALERNGEIVPKSRFREQTLQDGDKLEIVVAVGGG